jgi:DNA polymerase V|tara:strand:+ start:890 stop:1204 length:315 start_codon:yes stop_codon:yes gene_type:complete
VRAADVSAAFCGSLCPRAVLVGVLFRSSNADSAKRFREVMKRYAGSFDRFVVPQRFQVFDRINAHEGRGTVRLGRVSAVPEWAMKREMMSQRYTTRWDELMRVI